MIEDQQTKTTEGGAPPSEATPLAGGGTPTEKPRSGFQRQKLRIARLTELYGNLCADYDHLMQSHDKLERDHGALEQAFNEITELNASLAGEVRQLKQHRPAPVRFGQLLGGM